jgi:hypothetical protein
VAYSWKAHKALGWLVCLVAAGAVPAQAASVVTDGINTAGEWADASVIIHDRNEAGIPDDRDIKSIWIKGGHSLYLAVSAYGQRLDLAPRDSSSAFAFGFALGDGQTWRHLQLDYSQARPVDQRMRLLSLDGGARDLGAATYAVGDTLEIEVPWALLRPELPPQQAEVKNFAFEYRAVSGDVTGDGEVNLMDLGVLGSNWGRVDMAARQGELTGDGKVDISDLAVLMVNWGGHPYDTFDGTAAIERNLPVATHAPEPLTALSVVMALTSLGGYLRRRPKL